jgi:LysM repeat protein
MVLKNKSILILSSVVIVLFFLFSNSITINVNAETLNNSVNYTIKKGDTFYLLSLRFNCSVNDISSMNPKVDPYNLIIGSKIKQPIGSGIIVHHRTKLPCGQFIGTVDI